MPSTVVASMDYDGARKILRVSFVSGIVYEYKDVPEDVYIAMKTSGSKGIFLNQKIKGNYAFNKVS